MKKAMLWLALAGVGGVGCLTPDADKPRSTPPPTVAKKEPIKPVTAEDVSAANAQEAADKLRMELDRESGKAAGTAQQ